VTPGLTPSQTVGPFLAIALPWLDGPFVVPEGTPGAIEITGRLLDGAGQPVPDGMIETWQADPDGRFAHPDDPRGAAEPAEAAFRGFGRCLTGPDGGFRIVTLRPGPLPAVKGEGDVKGEGEVGGGGTEAPHLDVSVFARGILDRVVTRIYFPDEQEANAADPVLAAIVDPGRRATLVARAQTGGPPGRFRFDIRLQGAGETVFFDV
jgi:protocatechuate 3,4-dioxygenase, alpha subunit